tara:strand:+ start:16838 stop:17008 length:171 start_codon:yes stop_codon:yes gene_type:complete
MPLYMCVVVVWRRRRRKKKREVLTRSLGVFPFAVGSRFIYRVQQQSAFGIRIGNLY